MTYQRLTLRLAVVIPSLLALTIACGGKKRSSSSSDEVERGHELALKLEKDLPPGLAMRVSDGTAAGGSIAQLPPAKASKLSADDSAKVLARLPALVGEAGDKKDFALRERSLPPPLTGKTITGSFPPPPSSLLPPTVAADKDKLSVVRYAPEGDVPLVPRLNVTFSQPMIAVTSHADTVAKGVPVKLSPEPKGKWRWIGTKTLLFDAEVRFPQATTYKVDIPAGTKSANGNVLDKPVSFTFETPAPRLTASFPNHGPQPRDPVMFAAFDQDIDPAAVLAEISVRAGSRTHRVRAAREDEIKLDKRARATIEAAAKSEQKQRYVAFKIDERLPTDSNVNVTIGKGTPSAEGPNRTTSDQSFSFKTYGPLEIESSRCSWGSKCPPLTPWYIEFSNPLDAEAFDPAKLAIKPELAGMSTQVRGNRLHIRGRSKGRTTYKVTVPGSITDVFEQTMGKSETVTFEVGSANPQLSGPGGLVVLDPAAKKPTFDLFSINYKELEVKLYKVAPSDWQGFVTYMREINRSDKKPNPPGRKVFDEKVKVGGEPDEMHETHLDLSSALSGGLGHVVVIVEPVTADKDRYRPVLRAWVQSTRIGVDAFVDNSELIAWTTALTDGSALDGVEVEIVPFATKATTDASGSATLALSTGGGNDAHVLLARKGDDVAFLPENLHFWSDHGGWRRRDPGESLRWFVFDDRNMYRPGEEVHIKGWIRRVDNREGGDLGALQGSVSRVAYVLSGAQGNTLLEGDVPVSELGGFDTKFKLPGTANLGYARLRLNARGSGNYSNLSRTHSFQIQEFRRPEFEVNASASPGPHILGGGADVTVKAKYYAGGGLPNAEVNWTMSASVASFTPPNRADFTFGTWVPWWRHDGSANSGASQSVHHVGKTDAAGAHTAHIDFVSLKPPRPMSVTAQASVMDVNRQAWAASASLLVHPSDLYVGLRSERLFIKQGKALDIEAIVVDHDGTAVAARPLTMRAVRLEWTYEKNKWVEKEKDPQSCAPKSKAEAVKCSFETKTGGTYRVSATVVDDADRRNQSELTIWVSGGKQKPVRNVEQEAVTLIPDKKSYQPGDTAEILIQAPFYPASGVFSIRRSGIVSTEHFKLTGPSKTMTVAIVDGHIPNLHVQVDLVGAAARLDDNGNEDARLPKRPAFAKGSLNLSVPPTRRTLAVTIEPHKRKIEPGGQTNVAVMVRDSEGRPVANAELAVVVVDEAVLALSNYTTPAPIPAFYAQRGAGGRDYYLRSQVELARPDFDTLAAAGDGDSDDFAVQKSMDEEEMVMPSAAPAPMGKSEGRARPSAPRKRSAKEKSSGRAEPNTPIAVRKDFNALATFAPAVRTDASGKAKVAVKVPDNLTRYRVMVVAVAEDRQFGAGESSITARMPLMVRPSAPRFLNFGDRFELPVVLQNQTDDPMEVKIAVRTTNAELTDGNGRRLTIAGNDRVEVRFPAAAELAGTARFQIGAAAGNWADAAEFALPVWTPATTEAFATYGEIDEGAIRQPVALPGDVVKQFGGLEITTSSTQLQALTDAFLYLVAYPFECAEQLSSRVLAVAALRDVLSAFDAAGLPPVAEIEAAVARDLERLRGLQNHDGGFAFWRRGDESWPYVSIHVAHALTRAEAKGFAVQPYMRQRSLTYLQNIEDHIPGYYSLYHRRTLIAYALYVRKRMGDGDAGRGRKLIAEAGLDKLSMEAVGWLLAVLSADKQSTKELAAIHRHLLNKVTETAAAANFTTSTSDGDHLILHSSRRVDGIILESLIIDKPASDLIAKLVRGLLAHKKRGRWGNTQENAWVLLALDRYFNVFEKVTPNFVARAWLGDKFAGEHKFKGRTTERHQIDIPMSYVVDAKQADLVLAKDGKGRMYYRVGMTYAPADFKLPPADHGFAVERVYESVDDPADVRRDSDGIWRIKAGSRVRIRLTMVAQSRRYHVALVDPLPAGLEAMNPALAVTGSIPQDPNAQSNTRGRYWWWYRTWYEHQNMRDERVEAFTSLLWAGVHEYTYVARATTPGNFVVPPTKAEEMYHPETFGRAASDRVVVE